jgi:hypothetical protein
MEIKMDDQLFVQVNGAIGYDQYISILEKLVDNKETSGPEQSEEKILATSVNLQRMKRIARQTPINPEFLKSIHAIEIPLIWLVIAEAWCGDAAQNLPVIHRAAELSEGRIQLFVVFRDENPQLMNYFLTNGTKSIPKLICLNAHTNEVLGSWGPRPQLIQDLQNQYKKENPATTHQDLMYHLHLNYFHDKAHSLQTELIKMLDKCISCLEKTEIHH